MRQVIKRDKELDLFDSAKIKKAVTKANNAVKEDDRITEEQIDEIVENVVFDLGEDEKIDIEKIQDAVEKELSSVSYPIAKAYILKREERSRERRKASKFRKITKEKLTASNVQNSNANMDEFSFGGRMGEAASELAKQVAFDEIVSEQTRKNHENNEIYMHDANSIAIGMHNCLSIPFDDLLANGFVTRQTDIRPAGSISTAFQLLMVIFQLQSLQQFGGVSATHLDWTIVPYVRLSFFKHYSEVVDIIPFVKGNTDFKNKVKDISISDECYKGKWYNFIKRYIWKKALSLTTKELNQAVEGMYHNANTLQSRSGNQLPFTSINYGTCTLLEGRMVIKALLDGSLKGTGKFGRLAIFPCGIFQKMKGVNDKGSPNYDLYKLAVRSTIRRFYPNYANCDWSNQTKWVEFDRNIKQEVLNELTDEEKEKLISLIKENPEIGKQLSLKIEE